MQAVNGFQILALRKFVCFAFAMTLVVVSLFSTKASAGSDLSPLTIVSQDGARHAFLVEFAATPEERAQGLMFRRFLAADRGMLFDFGKDDEVRMWMKNTYIPLDMLFIKKNGVIHHIARDTEPHSLAIIESFGAVRGVLEVPAGTAQRLSLKTGDKVEHSMFSPD